MNGTRQVTLEDLFKKIALRDRIPLEDVKQIGKTIMQEIQQALLTQHEVKLPFGTFELIYMPPETHRNVRAQNVVRFGSGWRTEFRPNSTFRTKLRGEKEVIDDPDLYFRIVENKSRVGFDGSYQKREEEGWED